MNAPSCKPVVLLVLDGWGYSEQPEHNAILNARIPTWDHLWRDHPHLLIRCSGTDVGLPADQMGNSEVGHLNLGAGRVVYQEFTRISRAIKSGSFFTNSTLTDAVDAAGRQQTENVHGPAAGDGGVDCVGERAVGEERATLDGAADTGAFLRDHAAGAEIEMAHHGVAHLVGGQADIGARAANQQMGVVAPEVIPRGDAGIQYGVVLGLFTIAPAVQD